MPDELEVTGAVASPNRVAVVAGRLDRALDAIERDAGADHVTVVSRDGYRASIPFDVLRTGGVLSVEDSGWRLHVEEGRTHCWNVKDVGRLEFTVGEAEDDVAQNPPH